MVKVPYMYNYIKHIQNSHVGQETTTSKKSEHILFGIFVGGVYRSQNLRTREYSILKFRVKIKTRCGCLQVDVCLI